jgi:hypothetical protein
MRPSRVKQRNSNTTHRLVLTFSARAHVLDIVRWFILSPKFVALACVGVFLDLNLASNASAQTNAQVREAFQNLRKDNIRLNCYYATQWLEKHRQALRDQMLEELYRTDDPQARDALLTVLFETETFEPDERFARFVVQRLREEDSRVPIMSFGTFGPHHDAWYFIDRRYGLFEPLLNAEIGQTSSVWELWAIAFMFKRHNVLSANAHLYTDEVLGLAAAALKTDNVRFNASEAVRLFLMLPKQSTPIVRAVSNSSDPQQRYLARALLDALRGSKNAVGYLNSKLSLYAGPTGEGQSWDRPKPDWLDQGTEPYLEKDTYP